MSRAKCCSYQEQIAGFERLIRLIRLQEFITSSMPVSLVKLNEETHDKKHPTRAPPRLHRRVGQTWDECPPQS